MLDQRGVAGVIDVMIVAQQLIAIIEEQLVGGGEVGRHAIGFNRRDQGLRNTGLARGGEARLPDVIAIEFACADQPRQAAHTRRQDRFIEEEGADVGDTCGDVWRVHQHLESTRDPATRKDHAIKKMLVFRGDVIVRGERFEAWCRGHRRGDGRQRAARCRRALPRRAGDGQRREGLAQFLLIIRHADLEGIERQRDHRKVTERDHQFDHALRAEVRECCVEGGLADAMIARNHLHTKIGNEFFFVAEVLRRPAFTNGVNGVLRHAGLDRPVHPGAPFIGRVECARADQRGKAANTHSEDGFIGLPARMEIMSEVGEACGEIRAAVHQHDEGAGDRAPADRLDGIMKAALVFGKRVAFHGVESAQVEPLVEIVLCKA